MAKTRSKVHDALDRVDRLLDAARRTAPEPASKQPDSEWDIDTARHEIEELKATIARQPSVPEINVYTGMPPKDSDPPVASGGLAVGKHGVKIGRLPPIAVVVIAVAAIIGTVVGYVLTH